MKKSAWFPVVLSAVLLCAVCGADAPEYQGVIPEEAKIQPPSSYAVEVTYIANAGVLLTAGDTRVLIDGLFQPYQGYPSLPQSSRDQLETAVPPFDGIDVVLVSHIHGDHFQGESVLRYLQASTLAELVSSGQVVQDLRGRPGFATVAPRVREVTPALGERATVRVGGVHVDVLGVGHGTGRHSDIQNLGHIVTVGGLKFLHVGDADPTSGVLEKFNLAAERVDVAFLPAWFLTEGAAVIRDHIRPKHIVAVHMPPLDRVGPELFLKSFPDAVLFTRMLERRYY